MEGTDGEAGSAAPAEPRTAPTNAPCETPTNAQAETPTEAEADTPPPAEGKTPTTETETDTDTAADAQGRATDPEADTDTTAPAQGRATDPEADTDDAPPTQGRATDPEADTGTAADARGEAPGGDRGTGAPAAAPARRRPWRTWRADHPLAARILGVAVTLLAAALVVFSLVLPNQPQDIRLAQFARLPVEALIGAVVLTALPRRPRLVAASLGGIALGVLTILNLLDIGFNQYLGRGFNVIFDWPLFSDAESYLEDTLGRLGALGVVVAAITIVLVVLTFSALAVVRLGNLMARHRTHATRTILVLSMVWMTCQSLSLQFVNGIPLAAERTVTMVQYRSDLIAATVRDERTFSKTARVDAFGNTPGSQLVPGLRGKDMIFTFIESYGRSAIEDPIMAPGVDKTLDDSTVALAKAGFHAKSGWLTSATYGGSSWLGHSTFLSGLWIDNQNRYRTVTASDHLSLTKAFKRTGAWDTVGVMPGVTKGWPEAKFYGLDKVYDAAHLGYQGPKFSWSTMPDQYTLEAFQRLVHGKKRDKPLMSEIILTSSHTPWAPIPKMVGWDQLGNGSIFGSIEKAGNTPDYTYTNDTHAKEEYGKSVQYSVTSLTQFLERYGNDDTVLVFLGDHQANAHVSGNHASHDVPCAIVAKDPKVLDKVADWGWSDGLRPAHNAPVWKMSSFRDRFLTAYGSTPHPSKG
ncbi:hypothetical protein [Streptomyces sp. TP-A0356]|uniref:hypothetical protein n=1 Tax=Streptomyces sp. TP-A0356 TaxID=1359208 RepID=UPI00352BC0F4